MYHIAILDNGLNAPDIVRRAGRNAHTCEEPGFPNRTQRAYQSRLRCDGHAVSLRIADISRLTLTGNLRRSYRIELVRV